MPLDMDLLSAWPDITSGYDRHHVAPNPQSQRLLVEKNKALAKSKATPKTKAKAKGKSGAKNKQSKKAPGTKKPDTAYNVARKKFFDQLLA